MSNSSRPLADLNQPIPTADLDDFIDRIVARACPPPLVVSETAQRQLRPVFETLLRLRVAIEDIAMSAEGCELPPLISRAIAAATDLLHQEKP